MPRPQWARLYADLLEFEPYLVFGEYIGLVAEHPFTFSLTDTRPIRQKPFLYAREERQWLREYCEK